MWLVSAYRNTFPNKPYLEVGPQLNLQDADVRCSFPHGRSRWRVSSESKASRNSSTFSQCPDGVVLATFQDTIYLEPENTARAEESILNIHAALTVVQENMT
jgi:hypothetical protein